MRLRIFIFVCLFLAAIIQLIPQFTSEEEFRKYTIDLLKMYPPPTEARKLKTKFSFPKDSMINNEIYFKSTYSIARDQLMHIYVSSNNNNYIIKFSKDGTYLQKIGQKGKGPGDFYLPDKIRITDNHIIVKEYDRMQFLSHTGKYISSFKFAKIRIRDFEISDEGFIIAAPWIRSKTTPVLMIFSQEGDIISSFGKPKLLPPQSKSVLNYVNLAIDNKNDIIYVAYFNLSIVRKYGFDGKLIGEIRIKHNLLNLHEKSNLENLDFNIKNASKIKKNQSLRRGFRPVIHSIKMSQRGFYLLMGYPRIEILEYDSDGKLLECYYHNKDLEEYVSDFVVLDIEEGKLFYVLHPFPEGKVEVLEAVK